MYTQEFRGLNRDGKWVFGSGAVPVIWDTCSTNEVGIMWRLDFDEMDNYLPVPHFDIVSAATVGRYTGFKDENSRKIYEGDVLCNHGGYEPPDDEPSFYKVVYSNGAFELYDYYDDSYEMLLRDHDLGNAEVIGNIHEDLGLLLEKH